MATKSKAVSVKEDPVREVTRKETVRVLIHKTANDQGQDTVSIGVNGKVWLLKRGEEIEVPPGVASALKDAVRYEVGYDPSNHSTPVNEVQSYPFSIVG